MICTQVSTPINCSGTARLFVDLPYTFSKLRWLSVTKLNIQFQKLNFLSMDESWFADVREIAISLHQGIQSQALQLVGGLFSWHGDCGKVCRKVLFNWNWGMAALHFLEIYTRMFWSAETLYYSPVWHFVVATWETIVYSPILDLDR